MSPPSRRPSRRPAARPGRYALQYHLWRRPDPPRVLIIDPYPTIRAGLAELLRFRGMATTTTVAGGPTVAVVDPPRRSGLGVIADLHAASPRLPVIIHTAWHGPEAAAVVLQHGGFCLLPKGEVDPAVLVETIQAAHDVYLGGC